MSYISWMEYYQVAKELYDETGTINVPAKFEYRGYKIGDWVSRQRGIERRNGLKPNRKKLLEQLGVVWDGIKEQNSHQQFLLMYELLLQYKKEHGDTRVPRKYMVGDANLGNWASAIRESLRGTGRYKITDEQLSLLNQIGFEYDWYQEKIEASWNAQYDLVVEYARQYGIDSIIEDTTYQGQNIGRWIHMQRTSYKSGKLDADRYERLRSIGLDFNPALHRWDNAFSLAEQFYNEFHHLDIPDSLVMDGFCIGTWISNQRQVYHGTRTDMILTTEQIQRLESIGMQWRSSGAGNTSFVEQAFLYYIKTLFPETTTRDQTFGVELDIYVPSLNTAIEYDGAYWHKDKLEKDNAKDAVCKENGIRLIRIREHPLPCTTYAVCYCTADKYTNQMLDNLIRQILADQFGKILDVDTARDSLEISRNYQRMSTSKWKAYYHEAKRYYEQYRHLLVPLDYTCDNGLRLGLWIRNQRSIYKRNTPGYTGFLTEREIYMLEEIGMVWDVKKAMWENNYRIAEQYFREYGNLLVKSNCAYNGFALGEWVASQRRQYHTTTRKRLTDEKIQKLEAIGMVWYAKPKQGKN